MPRSERLAWALLGLTVCLMLVSVVLTRGWELTWPGIVAPFLVALNASLLLWNRRQSGTEKHTAMSKVGAPTFRSRRGNRRRHGVHSAVRILGDSDGA
ncbi:hypothetical protein BFN03_16520 [Rhodococcus sp. WMMA185]|uniref:hypothetical protein n=1 Tax=Rhodococcus sp. WMMA185 TaxID=679318 RepID=UPI000877ED31|nr:hypothetical protein [Rhodococcus sp. WMMA185]AOW93710.1 hypothetical protein BFN03_16520 [Rhodococcus sp. WMMA185]